MAASVAATAANATSGSVRWLFKTSASLPQPKSAWLDKQQQQRRKGADQPTLWAKCPEADQALQKAQKQHAEISPAGFSELLLQAVAKPIEAYRCRVDFAALKATLWQRQRPMGGKAVYHVTTEHPESLGATASMLQSEATTPWRDAHGLILKAAETGEGHRFGCK